MATQPNITPEMLRAMAAELELNPEDVGIPKDPEPSSTLKVTFNGVTFEANSQAELQNKLDLYQEGLRQQAQASRVTEHVEDTRKAETEAKKKTDPAWVQRFVEDPQSALEEFTEKKFGEFMTKQTGMPNWADFHKAMAAQAAQTQMQKVQEAFLKSNPDYVPDDTNVQLLGAIMKNGGLAPTLQNLDWAWRQAKASPAAKVAQPQAASVAPPKAPLPMVPTSGAADTNDDFLTSFYAQTDPKETEKRLRLLERMGRVQ